MMYLISLTPSDYIIEYIAIMRTFHFLIMNPKMYTNVLKIKIPHRLLISKTMFRTHQNVEWDNYISETFSTRNTFLFYIKQSWVTKQINGEM